MFTRTPLILPPDTHSSKPQGQLSYAQVSVERPIKTLVAEIHTYAKLAEEQLVEMAHQLEVKNAECARLRESLASLSASATAHKEVTNVHSEEVVRPKISELQQRADELRADIDRETLEKMRYVKQIYSRLYSFSPMTLNESLIFPERHNNMGANSLLVSIRTLPEANLSLLSMGNFFVFASASIGTAIHQYRRLGSVNLDRCVIAGVAAAGTRISLSSALGHITAQDFDTL